MLFQIEMGLVINAVRVSDPLLHAALLNMQHQGYGLSSSLDWMHIPAELEMRKLGRL